MDEKMVQEKLEQAQTPEEMKSLAAEMGVELTDEQANRLMEAKGALAGGDDAELSDEELDGATGGVAWTSIIKDIWEGLF